MERSDISDGVGNIGHIDRNVLLIRLADQLEHYQDFGGLYYHGGIEEYREFINRNGSFMVEMAEKLGFSALAADLTRIFRKPIFAKSRGRGFSA